VKLRYVFFTACILVITASGCKKSGGRFLKEGEIHYTVDYIGNVSMMPKDLMPKTLVVSFKDDNILYELISPFGNSGITNLSNPSKDIYDTYLSMFTIRYFYASKPGEVYPGFERMDSIEIRETGKSSVICGFRCENAVVTFKNEPGKVYDIWYTDEISVKNPNASTPFNKIDGVLMSFFFVIGKSEFHFQAENVYKKEISDETFERKAKFRRVSRDDINKFINKMVSL